MARVNGASLLVYALAGPDGQGTAGFRDLNLNGTWGDDMGGRGSGGLYDDSVVPTIPRYGPYAGSTLVDSVKRIRELKYSSSVLISNQSDPYDEQPPPDPNLVQQVFADAFGRPVLYYRARRGASRMIYNPSGDVGVYDHRDNAWFTGANVDLAGQPSAGTRFTFGSVTEPHAIAITNYDTTAPTPPAGFGVAGVPTFDSFILDRDASTNPGTGEVIRAVPVRAQSYLLISAGKDGIYGSDDDITNWGR
jgi:hypothetical protein